jgi:hypothetical protein
MEGILGQMRIGHMALFAVDGQEARETAAPSVLDRIPQLLATRRLADQGIVDVLAALLEPLDDLGRAVDCRAFLVAGEKKRDRAWMARVRGDEGLDRRHHGRDRALHIRRAPSVEHPVANDRVEGVGIPEIQRPGRHHVGMSGQTQQWSLGAAPRPEIRDLAEGHRLDGEADRRQTLGDEFLTALILGRDRGTADEFTGQFERGRHRGNLRSI